MLIHSPVNTFAVRGSDSMRTFVLSIFCKEGTNYGFRHVLFNKQPEDRRKELAHKWELADKFFPSIQDALTVGNVHPIAGSPLSLRLFVWGMSMRACPSFIYHTHTHTLSLSLSLSLSLCLPACLEQPV